MSYRKETFETFESQAKAEAPGITKVDYEKRFNIIYEKMHDYAQKRRLEVNANIKDAMDISAVQKPTEEEADPDADEKEYYAKGQWINNMYYPPDYDWSQFYPPPPGPYQAPEQDINAFQSKGGKAGGGKGTCFSCGETGHIARNCPEVDNIKGKGKGKKQRMLHLWQDRPPCS